MIETVLAALITGGLSLIGVVISNLATAHKTELTLKVNQAVTDTKLEALANELRKYNGLAERVPVLEEKINVLKQRIADLEKGTKND